MYCIIVLYMSMNDSTIAKKSFNLFEIFYSGKHMVRNMSAHRAKCLEMFCALSRPQLFVIELQLVSPLCKTEKEFCKEAQVNKR